ncbi:hypothetical protein J4Q44_G00316040 [Coregonus suidteri]|uniref:Uncharacterized protein n=1 Tax=Coregonus suidteri TaxID=861788 RepID=A0AAN8QBF4_9TELE
MRALTSCMPERDGLCGSLRMTSKTCQANLCLVSKFDTVEDFWALYNHIQLSSNLISGWDYTLFKPVALAFTARVMTPPKDVSPPHIDYYSD